MLARPVALSLVIGVALAMAAMFGSGASANGAGSTAGTIETTVVNGTTGDSPVPNLNVVLHSQIGDVTLPDVAAITDLSGKISFGGLDRSPLARYLISGDYSGVTFESNDVKFAPDSPQQKVQLQIWDTTSDDPGLRVASRLLVLSAPDATAQTIPVLELITFENPAKRAYVPSMSGTAGPMGLIRFGLPVGSSQVQSVVGLDPRQIIQIDAGIATTNPIPPGKYQMGFAYQFPYVDHAYSLRKNLQYPTDDFRVLIPPALLHVSSKDLSPAGQATIGGRQYDVLAGTGLKKDATITLNIDQLPLQPGWRRLLTKLPKTGLPPWSLLPFSALAAATPAVVLIASRRQKGSQSTTTAVALRLTLEELIDLDERFQSGVLPRADYERQRAITLAKAIELRRMATQ